MFMIKINIIEVNLTSHIVRKWDGTAKFLESLTEGSGLVIRVM